MDSSTPRTRSAIKNIAQMSADAVLAEGLKRSRDANAAVNEIVYEIVNENENIINMVDMVDHIDTKPSPKESPIKSPKKVNRNKAAAPAGSFAGGFAGSKMEPIEINSQSSEDEKGIFDGVDGVDDMWVDDHEQESDAKDPNPSPSKKQRAYKSTPKEQASKSTPKEQASKSTPKGSSSTSTSSSSSSSHLPHPAPIVAEPKKPKPLTLTDLTKLVTDVFPDACPDHTKSLLKRFRCTEEHHLPTVLTHMLTEGYTKVTLPTHLPSESLTLGLGLTKKYKRDYTSSSWTTSPSYRSDSLKRLLNDFSFLAVTGMSEVFEKYKFHYYHMHEGVCSAVSGPLDSEGKVLGEALTGKVNKEGKRRLKEMGLQCLRRPRRRKAHPEESFTDLVLMEEVEFVEERLKEKQVDMDAVISIKLARARAEERGELMECECCYDDVCFEEMCQCTGGHLFCLECLRRFAEEKLFGQQSTVLGCMAQNEDGNKCEGTFTDSQLERALPKKVMRKLQEAIYEKAVEDAKMDDIAKCPICDFTAVCEDRVFKCPALGCGYESCKDCGEPPHFPLKCSEVEKTSHAESRKKIEEAMTMARVRECPDCGKRFFKTEGCNKMSCSCGGLSCYICREKLERSVGYKHFCQVSGCDHSSCGRCPLFSDSVEDDRRAMREAGLKAMAENENELLRGAKKDLANGEEVKSVDVDTLLEDKPTDGEAARIAQQNAHLGVGAMARVAYQEIDNANRRRAQQPEPGAPRQGVMGRIFGGGR
ncbi:hypothetical protein TrST_g3687 [Triparma strigata]|uniref:RING-type domain-containing protein n=1 Tax=Triparma strigata TaxID=1606541 RepID=A0A9W6ZI42_9STRA|nr:hypothetical protein TrST_g3687 [Triparma strigata]